MPQSDHNMTPRRDFLKSTARLAAASTLASVAVPHVHAGEDNTIRLAIVGSGSRGSGAVADALSATEGPVKLVAMADLLKDRLASSHKALSKQFGEKIDVPEERRIYKDQQTTDQNVAWKAERERSSPYHAEWKVLLDAIRNDRPHNEARRAAFSNLTAMMGRAAVHSGKTITWDEAIASNFRFYAGDVAELTADSPAPVHADAEGRYPAPIPGAWSEI
jgi:predicted dehydrogenase